MNEAGTDHDHDNARGGDTDARAATRRHSVFPR
jgi:hypothetical protein